MEAAEIGLVNDAVEQNAAGDAAYKRAIELAEEIIPNVSIGTCKPHLIQGKLRSDKDLWGYSWSIWPHVL